MFQHWKPYRPSSLQPWNIDRVKHLHRRAGFGATWLELQRDLRDGPEQSVTRLLEGRSRVYGQRNDFLTMAETLGQSAAQSNDENRLRAWWIFRCLFTPDPLREKMTWMWHNHFATSNLKVNNLHWIRRQNELFRRHALNPFGELLHEVIRDPAMLFWLDANSNRKDHPNENFARELMELFTLGIGNYTEEDVKQAARAMTGWTIRSGQGAFLEEHHDAESKTVLGRTECFDASSLTDHLLNQDATCRRLSWRLCDLFMGEQPIENAAMEELAQGLRTRQLDIRWAVSTILQSERFFSSENIGTKISSPLEYIIHCVRSLEMLDKPPSTLILADWCSRLGQELFRPPNVGGWPGGRAWLNARTIIGRANFVVALATGETHSPPQPLDLSKMLEQRRESNEFSKATTKEWLETLLLSSTTNKVETPTTNDPLESLIELLRSPESYLM